MADLYWVPLSGPCALAVVGSNCSFRLSPPISLLCFGQQNAYRAFCKRTRPVSHKRPFWGQNQSPKPRHGLWILSRPVRSIVNSNSAQHQFNAYKTYCSVTRVLGVSSNIAYFGLDIVLFKVLDIQMFNTPNASHPCHLATAVEQAMQQQQLTRSIQQQKQLFRQSFLYLNCVNGE